jgi:hypothetical protein
MEEQEKRPHLPGRIYAGEAEALLQRIRLEGGQPNGVSFSDAEALLLATFTLDGHIEKAERLRCNSLRYRAEYYARCAKRLEQARAYATARLPKRRTAFVLGWIRKLEAWWALRPLRSAYEVAEREARDAQELQGTDERGLRTATLWLLQELRISLRLLSAEGYYQKL